MQLTAAISDMVPLSVVATVGLWAAVNDIRCFKVHNHLTVPLALSGLVFHAATGGLAGFGFSVSGFGIGFASLVLFYVMGGVGAGDVKLMAGVGAWLGGWLTVNVIVFAGLAAGLYSLAMICSCGGYRHIGANLSILIYRVRAMAWHFGQDERIETVVARGIDRRRLVPFAAMVMTGIVCVMLGLGSYITP